MFKDRLLDKQRYGTSNHKNISLLLVFKHGHFIGSPGKPAATNQGKILKNSTTTTTNRKEVDKSIASILKGPVLSR